MNLFAAQLGDILLFMCQFHSGEVAVRDCIFEACGLKNTALTNKQVATLR